MGVWGKGKFTHKEIDWPRSFETNYIHKGMWFVCGQDISFLILVGYTLTGCIEMGIKKKIES